MGACASHLTGRKGRRAVSPTPAPVGLHVETGATAPLSFGKESTLEASAPNHQRVTSTTSQSASWIAPMLAAESAAEVPAAATAAPTQQETPLLPNQPPPLHARSSASSSRVRNALGGRSSSSRGPWIDRDGSGRDLVGTLSGTPVHAVQLSDTCAIVDVEKEGGAMMHVMVRRRISRSSSDAEPASNFSFIVLPSP